MRGAVILVLGSMGLGSGCSEPPVDDGPEWSHCPDSNTFEGKESWTGQLEVTSGALYCEHPSQNASLENALTLTKQLRIVAGTYPLPDVGEDHSIYLPMCLRDAKGPLENTLPGLATAGTYDFMGSASTWWVQGHQQRVDGAGYIRWQVYGDAEKKQILLDGSEPLSQERQILHCENETCDFEDLSLMVPCALEPTTCDQFTLEGGDYLDLDQYHWVGMAGAGFANIIEARGRFRGTEFAVSNPNQLFMAYGHHAFTRSGLVFFDAPIGEACGLYVDEVTGNSGLWTVDCDGVPIEQLTVTEEVHGYQQGPCPQ